MSTFSEDKKQIAEFNAILLDYYKRNRNSNTEENKEDSISKLKFTVRTPDQTKTTETQTSDVPTPDGPMNNDGTTSQYHNFIRLSLLFPDLHPATLHGALGLCKNDFILTVDSLIYARNYRKSSENNSNMENVNKTTASEILNLSPWS
ncbi:uncharacterized protein LOC123291528 [Chrysoperla carnea]|uniref:uncharacterized protein LOC123291528 n=1 Tax=Chrysoperla carnea TaxID=189513 RepID=UPI001D087229|nr:uncharacterized protein LOC123291528 [Chrysoperla carnea]